MYTNIYTYIYTHVRRVRRILASREMDDGWALGHLGYEEACRTPTHLQSSGTGDRRARRGIVDTARRVALVLVRGFLDEVYAPCPHGGFWPLRGYSRLRPLRCRSIPWRILDASRGGGRKHRRWNGWAHRRPCCRGCSREGSHHDNAGFHPGAVGPPTGSRGDRKPRKKEETRGSGGEAVWSAGEKNEEERCDTQVDIPTVVRTLPWRRMIDDDVGHACTLRRTPLFPCASPYTLSVTRISVSSFVACNSLQLLHSFGRFPSIDSTLIREFDP